MRKQRHGGEDEKSPSADWTCKKGWTGIDLDVDKALKK